jgi:predicted molibdopterin-dependent oxidoreductase YjgC
MHRLKRDDTSLLTFYFEGQELHAAAGDTVAAALLAHEQVNFRSTSVSNTARGPYCMMGVCFECLVEVDGVANRQACMLGVREGMRVKRQIGAIDILTEAGDAADIPHE